MQHAFKCAQASEGDTVKGHQEEKQKVQCAFKHALGVSVRVARHERTEGGKAKGEEETKQKANERSEVKMREDVCRAAGSSINCTAEETKQIVSRRFGKC